MPDHVQPVNYCIKWSRILFNLAHGKHYVLLLKMVRIFGWFLYFTMAFKVRSSILCIIGSKFDYWQILGFFTVFEK